MKLSARDTKIFDDVLVYAKKNQEKDEKAKMFIAYSEKENLTKSELGYIKNYISVYRLNDQIERKHRREKTKEVNAAGKRRKALNAAKFGLGGFILSEMKNNTDPKFKDLFMLVGMMSGLTDSQHEMRLALSKDSNSIQISLNKVDTNLLKVSKTILNFFVDLEDDVTYGFSDLPIIMNWVAQRPTIDDEFIEGWADDGIKLPKETAKWVSYVVFSFLEFLGYLDFDAVNQKFIFRDGFGFEHTDPTPKIINYPIKKEITNVST